MGDRRSDRLENAGRYLGKPIRKKKKKKKDPPELTPERMEEIQKAADELWGTG